MMQEATIQQVEAAIGMAKELGLEGHNVEDLSYDEWRIVLNAALGVYGRKEKDNGDVRRSNRTADRDATDRHR